VDGRKSQRVSGMMMAETTERCRLLLLRQEHAGLDVQAFATPLILLACFG
jgi:hypothetical protein